ncbi:hypothetical protein BJ322DRAFT_1105853 [Thelephora terrestris]|uniref:Uncharacterized protein n=1 Tax=Thelephora terrestris TaxID=56493 RepID=A0A9P6HIS4_9AGAM|nr:hypothetical protein BJ322DRAFT_1105853 [Thelephora terrestris]
MADADWSFSLRSGTGFFNGADSDDENEENLGNAGISFHLSSSSQMLQQIDLAAREDSAQYKANPWSIARVNAASRPRQPTASVNSVSEKAVAKKPPQGAIVDAFKRQVQKPKATTNSLAQDDLPQTSSEYPASTSVIGVPNNLAPATACSATPIAHIATSGVGRVPIPSQPSTLQQNQGPSLSPFLPGRAYPASYPRQSTVRSPNLHFTPSLNCVLPFSSPGHLSPQPQRFNPTISRPRVAPPQASAHFGPHIFEPQPTNTSSNEHSAVDKSLIHPSPARRPAKLEAKTVSPYPRQNIRISPRLQSNKLIKATPKSEEIPHSPSFAQARRFFEHGPPPVNTTNRLSPEPASFKEEESLPRPRTTTPPRKRADPYDQLPPSPDSEWSTLKPQTRKANGKTKLKALDAKSGKFRLPLSFGTATPNEPPQKKVRVVTYLPPPPSKKQKTVEGLHPRTSDVEAISSPRNRTSGLPSPPPSDETVPPSSPTPSVQFDSDGVSTRYKIVRAKIRQRKALDVQLWGILGLESCGVVYRDPEYAGGVDAWNGEIPFVTWCPRGA